MIEFEDGLLGRVIIFEPIDVPRQRPYLPNELIDKYYMNIPNPKVNNASIIGYRSVISRESILFKNKYGPLEDFETKQFILNYKVEIVEDGPAKKRWEILDIRD